MTRRALAVVLIVIVLLTVTASSGPVIERHAPDAVPMFSPAMEQG